MADLIEELEQSWQAAPRADLEAELERSWQPPQQPAPEAQPLGYNIPGALQWLYNNPKGAIHGAVQGGMAAGGTVLGGLSGNPWVAGAGGATGSVLGDALGRLITGQEMPTGPEAAISAGLGAVGGPLAGAPRGAGRLLAGANATVRREAGEAAVVAGAEASELASRRTFAELMDMSVRDMAAAQTAAAEAATLAGDRAILSTLQRNLGASSERAGRFFEIGALAPAAWTFLHGDIPTAAAWLAGGAAATYTRRQATEYLLERPWFINAIMRTSPGVWERGSAAVLSAALSGASGLSRADRQAVEALTHAEQAPGHAGLPRQAAPASNPFAELFTTPQGGTVGRGRDGRFMSIEDIPTLGGN